MGSEGSFGDVTAQIIRTLYMDGHMVLVGSRVVQVEILGSRKWGKNEVGWERVARRADLEQSYVLAESTNTDRQRLAISFVICSCFHCDFFQFSFSISISILLPCPLSFVRCWCDRENLLSNKFCHLEPLSLFGEEDWLLILLRTKLLIASVWAISFIICFPPLVRI